MARWPKRPRADHTLRADDCRRHPRVWIQVGIYNSGQSATSTARHIRRADTLPQYTPAGAFETRTAPVESGTALYARYTGATQ
ncbi:hypothetical protein [Streptomyces sp. NPDC046332]|uniref:hypothetical protein n=1 Tax=unclassified Streptomyces TaxID=2593676 RepID=UPI0033FEE17F